MPGRLRLADRRRGSTGTGTTGLVGVGSPEFGGDPGGSKPPFPPPSAFAWPVAGLVAGSPRPEATRPLPPFAPPGGRQPRCVLTRLGSGSDGRATRRTWILRRPTTRPSSPCHPPSPGVTGRGRGARPATGPPHALDRPLTVASFRPSAVVPSRGRSGGPCRCGPIRLGVGSPGVIRRIVLCAGCRPADAAVIPRPPAPPISKAQAIAPLIATLRTREPFTRSRLPHADTGSSGSSRPVARFDFRTILA